jgi:hypothetical protein
VVVEKNASIKKVKFTSDDGVKIVNFTNDISCKAYDGRNPETQQTQNKIYKDPQKIRFA